MVRAFEWPSTHPQPILNEEWSYFRTEKTPSAPVAGREIHHLWGISLSANVRWENANSPYVTDPLCRKRHEPEITSNMSAQSATGQVTVGLALSMLLGRVRNSV